MIESASIQNAKNYSRADMNRAMESVFAEYQKELLEDYDIFALEGSYETGRYSEESSERTAWVLRAGSMEHKVRAIEFLTDQGGRAFYRQAAAIWSTNTGCPLPGTGRGRHALEAAGAGGEEGPGTGEGTAAGAVGSSGAGGGSLPEKDNPIAHVDKLKSSPLLDLVTPKEMTVSQKVIRLEETASHRTFRRDMEHLPREKKKQGRCRTSYSESI